MEFDADIATWYFWAMPGHVRSVNAVGTSSGATLRIVFEDHMQLHHFWRGSNPDVFAAVRAISEQIIRHEIKDR